MEPISKTAFKAHALEIFRDIEQSGQLRIITDRGKPTLEIRKLRQQNTNPFDKLQGTVIRYAAATAPVAEADWENTA